MTRRAGIHPEVAAASPRPERLPALTGLRGLAAFWVMWCHLGPEVMQLWPALAATRGWAQRGGIAVDGFFVLSGFLVSHVHAARARCGGAGAMQAHGRFVLARLARIYPSHLIALGGLVAMWVLARVAGWPVEGNYSGGSLVAQMLLVHGLPWWGGPVDLAWNYPSWSLSLLLICYAFVFPATVAVFGREACGRTCARWVAAGAPVFAAGLLLGCGPGPWQRVGQLLLGFAGGAALWWTLGDDRAGARRLGRGAGWVLPVLLALALLPRPAAAGAVDLVVVAGLVAWPLMVAGLCRADTGVARVLGVRPMQWLGRVSFALYVTHALAEKALKILLPPGAWSTAPAGARLLVAACYVAGPLVLAAVFFRAVEEPARRALKRVRPTPSPAVVSA